MKLDKQLTKAQQEILTDRIEEQDEMLRLLTLSLTTIHEKDHLNGGARMMLASMGRATVIKSADFWQTVESWGAIKNKDKPLSPATLARTKEEL